MKLTTKGENLIIITCIIDILMISNNANLIINILLYISYLIKVIVFIKYNTTFKK